MSKVYSKNQAIIPFLLLALLSLQSCTPALYAGGACLVFWGTMETIDDWEQRPGIPTGPTGKKYFYDSKVGILDLSSFNVDMQSFPEIRAKEIVAVSDEKSALLVMSRDAQFITLETFSYDGKKTEVNREISSPVFLPRVKDYKVSPDWHYMAYIDPGTDELRLIDLQTQSESIVFDQEQKKIFGSSIVQLAWGSNEDLIFLIEHQNKEQRLLKMNILDRKISLVYETKTPAFYNFHWAWSADGNILIFPDDCADENGSFCHKMKMLDFSHPQGIVEIELGDKSKTPASEFCISPDNKRIVFLFGGDLMLFQVNTQQWQKITSIKKNDQLTHLGFLNEKELIYLLNTHKRKASKLEILEIETGKIIQSLPVAEFSPFYIIENGTKILCDFDVAPADEVKS